MSEKTKVFVIMPFSDDFFESYEMLKTHFEDSFDFSHAGDEDNQQNILNGMNSEMQEMSSGMNKCTEEIERVKKTGGSGTASFAKKQSRKVAGYIETFSKQLKGRTETNASLWGKIEKNVLGLLENQYAAKDENKESLVKYLKALHGMQVAIRTSNESIKTMKQTSLNNLGIQRNLNQSIRFLDEDLATYLTMTEQMDASINRIMDKSRFVVGEIDFSEEETENA